MAKNHREVREQICLEVVNRLNYRPFVPAIPLEAKIDLMYRKYRNSGRPLLDENTLDENGESQPRRQAVDTIAIAVMACHYEALKEIFSKKKEREEFYQRYADHAADDDRFKHLRELLEGAEPTDHDAIILIGVAGVKPEQARILARHWDPDYRGIARKIKQARGSQLVTAAGEAKP